MWAWWEFLRSSLGKGLAEFVALFVIALASLAVRAIWNVLRSWIDYHKRLRRVHAAIDRESTPTGLREGRGLWLTEPIEGADAKGFRDRLDASRILVVANAKGGVGKTTTVANLGARLAEVLPKPVLMIDLDFQGTLSSMSIASSHWVPPKGSDSRASHLISGDLTPQDIANTGQTAAGEVRLKILTAFYDLAQAENRVMIDWLIGDRTNDVRFRLADLLHSPAVRDAFSLVVIDCPPRFTTASIQALAAGTHLLIPTVLDDPSAEAVKTFVREVERFRKAKLCPYIKYIGIAGSMEPPVGNIEGALKRLKDRLQEVRSDGDPPVGILPENTFLPRSAHFMNAVSQGGIAYVVMGNAQAELAVKARIRALADLVKQEMKL